jgi:hypothetical protein
MMVMTVYPALAGVRVHIYPVTEGVMRCRAWIGNRHYVLRVINPKPGDELSGILGWVSEIAQNHVDNYPDTEKRQ